MLPPELEGRLAALELVTAIALTGAGQQYAGSAWPNLTDAQAEKAITEIRATLSGEAATAAEDSLRKMFNRSKLSWKA